MKQEDLSLKYLNIKQQFTNRKKLEVRNVDGVRKERCKKQRRAKTIKNHTQIQTSESSNIHFYFAPLWLWTGKDVCSLQAAAHGKILVYMRFIFALLIIYLFTPAINYT